MIRTLLDEGSIDFQGDFFRYSGIGTAARPVQEHVPLKLGAMGGPKSMQLAGEIADGLHTACAYSAEALRYAVHHFNVGADRAGRDADRLDIGDSLLGAIAPDPDVARRAGRILAAFYIPSMPAALLGGTASIPAKWRPSTRRSLRATSSVRSTLHPTPSRIASWRRNPRRLGRWLTRAYAPVGLNHALLSFTDPFTLKAWAHLEVAGLPDLVEQVRLFGEHVLPQLPLTHP